MFRAAARTAHETGATSDQAPRVSARYVWQSRTAIDPSPTAEAVRRMAPLRTSPTAKTPGRLASNRNGSRAASCQAGAVLTDSPVEMKPFSSSANVSANHAVGALAPIKMNRAATLMVRRSPVYLCSTVTPVSAFSPTNSCNTRLGQQLDVGRRHDAVDEVARHVLIEIIAARQQVDLLRALRQEQRRLPGGVTAADDRDILPLADLGLDLGRGVIDVAAFQLGLARHTKFPVPRAERQDDAAGDNLFSVIEGDGVGVSVTA